MPPQQEDRTGAVDLRGLPAKMRSTRAKFEFLQHCSAYWRMKVHYERNRDEPGSIFNNPGAVAAKPPIERRLFERSQAIIAAGDPGCEHWMREVSIPDANWQFYNATLAEALDGSGAAALCFVASSWNPLDVLGSVYPFLSRNYARHARHFIDREIANGSWPMVLAAYNAQRAHHGVQTAVTLSKESRYLWSRLMELGAHNPDFRSAYAQDAAEHGAGLTPTQFAEADAEANALYRGAFASRQMTEDEFYENCGNL
ncbi:hypothetical protein [Luteimonas flava]|uniref:hypothetical protein n=1 Tax=Luteimonas flava TaxID=3115822 RepID=UPI002F966450